MSGRINKSVSQRAKPLSQRKISQRDSLLAAVLSSNPIDMAPCSYCERRQLECKVSDSDSSRCSSCIRHNRSQCDVSGLNPEQLQKVASQHRKLELELEAAEEEADAVNARLRRLRRQKRVWYEKMMKAVSRGIDNLEELEKLEAEERRAENARPAGSAEASVDPEVVPDFDWSGMDMSGDLDWDAILAGASVGVGENSSEGVGRSSGG